MLIAAASRMISKVRAFVISLFGQITDQRLGHPTASIVMFTADASLFPPKKKDI
jgi:hypothetical protein